MISAVFCVLRMPSCFAEQRSCSDHCQQGWKGPYESQVGEMGEREVRVSRPRGQQFKQLPKRTLVSIVFVLHLR